MKVDIQNADVATLNKDRMRYKTNSLSSNLALLAVVINVLFFVCIYKSDVEKHYYSYKIGLSVLYNLIFMLVVFLSSIGVKNYKISFGIVLIVMGALQLLRIVYIPLDAYKTIITPLNGAPYRVMGKGQFIRTLIYLIGSSALLIASGVIGIIRSKILTKYKRQIGEEQPA